MTRTCAISVIQLTPRPLPTRGFGKNFSSQRRKSWITRMSAFEPSVSVAYSDRARILPNLVRGWTAAGIRTFSNSRFDRLKSPNYVRQSFGAIIRVCKFVEFLVEPGVVDVINLSFKLDRLVFGQFCADTLYCVG